MKQWDYHMIPVLRRFQQNDSYNCGVYMLAYISQLVTIGPEKVLNNKKYFSENVIDRTQQKAWTFRRFIFGVILEYIGNNPN